MSGQIQKAPSCDVSYFWGAALSADANLLFQPVVSVMDSFEWNKSIRGTKSPSISPPNRQCQSSAKAATQDVPPDERNGD
ncbi:hypothetical protein HDF16_001954 [Granulicella aggregans]|uniref:Uncharacterized protein n=1 Tax=Granulicella aggregans TaxID=474949 RepID=A0A7W7ZCY5_9BACT|nr:hypothetical protein [Granulicella aggregans]MBB5057269.1 hypothetical protein [Granulicella aggregans]